MPMPMSYCQLMPLSPPAFDIAAAACFRFRCRHQADAAAYFDFRR
jgi:hypothetical protein